MSKHHNQDEIVEHLRTVEIGESEGRSTKAMARVCGVSHATIIRWRKEYGDSRASQLKRLRELEEENAHLKGIIINQALEISSLKKGYTSRNNSRQSGFKRFDSSTKGIENAGNTQV